MLGGGIGDGALGDVDAGVVDEDVDGTEGSAGFLDGGVDLGIVADIGWADERLAAALTNGLRDRFQGIDAAGDEADVGAGVREGEGDGFAKAAAGTGDEDGLCFRVSA